MVVERVVEGVLVDPDLPDRFWSIPMEKRPAGHLEYWEKPFVQSVPHLHPPRFDVFCLDGGSWLGLTCWGKFATLEEAIGCARKPNGLPLKYLDRLARAGI